MSEFFKAATKCDVSVAQRTPMHIDQRGVMEELYRHERLVEHSIATQQLLDTLDEQDRQKEAAAAAHYSEATELLYQEGDVPGRYVPPPHSTVGELPENRPPGAKLIQRALQERLSKYKNTLDTEHDSLVQQESREQTQLHDDTQRRKDLASRELNALVVSRQQATKELKEEIAKQRIEVEQTRRRVHPIDVLQKKIAADLLEEIYEATTMTEFELKESQVGIEHFVESEQLRGLQYKYHGPSKHIPNGLIAQ